jgi:hypothetical protein
MDLAGPQDEPAIVAFNKVDERFTTCLGAYLAKHDPTWGHKAEVYKLKRSGQVVNVSDEIGRAGAARCGERTLDLARAKLDKQLAATRTARYKAHVTAVRKRFGL